MANTYTQIHVHIVFAVQGRQRLIPRTHKEELQRYITGIVTNQGHKLIAINCQPDHTHVFVGMRPDAALSDLVRDVKACSSAFITERNWIHGTFRWQEGFGAFSHCHNEVSTVAQYVFNQEEHHRRKTFREEYLELLEDFKVNYDRRFLFEWIDTGES
jgi:putative transposase